MSYEEIYYKGMSLSLVINIVFLLIIKIYMELMEGSGKRVLFIIQTIMSIMLLINTITLCVSSLLRSKNTIVYILIMYILTIPTIVISVLLSTNIPSNMKPLYLISSFGPLAIGHFYNFFAMCISE